MARKRKPTGRRPSKSRGKGYRDRRVDFREIKQRFLIVCEGAKTEPQYFKKFKTTQVVIDVQNVNRNPTRLIDRATKLRKESTYDQVWCVFDRDSWTEEDFNKALSSARQADIRVAYSNEAFELWYLLHFEYHDIATPRSEYSSRLTRHMGKPYAKNSKTMFDELEERAQAI